MDSIYTLFPIVPVPRIKNLSDERLLEIEDFVGKKYTELENVNFGKNYSVFFFFFENEFVYYFPSLILASKINFSNCRWCIEYTVDLFISDKEFQKKWENFSMPQRLFIANWLKEISNQFEDEEVSDNLYIAIKMLQEDEQFW